METSQTIKPVIEEGKVSTQKDSEAHKNESVTNKSSKIKVQVSYHKYHKIYWDVPEIGLTQIILPFFVDIQVKTKEET